jgi:putative ABC transport system substrate-binding protein
VTRARAWALAIVGLAAAGVAAMSAPAAPPDAHVPWIGYLANEPTPDSIPVLRNTLRTHGWDEGRSVKIYYRYAQGKVDLYPQHAEELARLNVAVIVAVGAPAIEAARAATKTIPIVMVSLDDPVVTRLVAASPRSDANLTGLTTFVAGQSRRRLELLKQAVPRLARATALWNPASASVANDLRETQAAARTLGVELMAVELRADRDVRDALAAVQAQEPQGLVVLADSLALANRERIVTFTSRNRLPAVYPLRDFADAGGFLSYGPSWTDVYRMAAGFVDKILRGARPADLPLARPTRFELVINLRAAQKLDLRVPSSLLERADRLIE